MQTTPPVLSTTRTRSRRRAGAVGAAVVALLAASTLATPTAGAAATNRAGAATALSPKIAWGECPADIRAESTQLQCATIRVPLDYQRPHGRRITVAVSRLPSTDSAKRRGVLLVNSGGPGGPGLIYPERLADGVQGSLAPLPASVRERYDLIGFDPRGVGHSTPVTCNLTTVQQITNIPAYARNSADVTTTAAAAKQIAHQCTSSATASVLRYITTANTARDMDRIRAALGEKKVSYLGDSYGTYLGAVYTTLFPQRSDRILLDSSLSPGGWSVAFQRRIAQGVQDRFPDFARYAAARPRLGLGYTPGQVAATYRALASRFDARPGPGGITGALFRQNMFSLLYYDSDFPTLAANWVALKAGKPLPAPATTDAATGSASSTASATEPTDNEAASQLTVICNDTAWRSSVGTYQQHVALDRRRYPIFGAATANISPCAYWPSPLEAPVHITSHGPSDVLIAQNLRDPVTPLSGALLMRTALDNRARMVTADQGGHLAYEFLSNRCLNDTVTHFLDTGHRPRRDRFCPAEPH